MTKDKAMKMAFFAMLKIKENKSDPAFTHQDVLDAIEVLRTALAQPEKEWVGLTDEEIKQGNRGSWVTPQAWDSAVWWAEAKLKEKNT